MPVVIGKKDAFVAYFYVSKDLNFDDVRNIIPDIIDQIHSRIEGCICDYMDQQASTYEDSNKPGTVVLAWCLTFRITTRSISEDVGQKEINRQNQLDVITNQVSPNIGAILSCTLVHT